MAELPRNPLLPLDEALQRLADGAGAVPITDTEAVSTFEALGRVLAQDVSSLVDVPPADNAAMDGYAMSVNDVPAAGTVLPGTAARIFTGAQVPAGADAVVMQEQCEAYTDNDGGRVRINIVPEAGLAIRRRGEDVAGGAVVLARGTRLGPQALGLAASVGAGELTVLRRPRVAVFSTGDELVMPGQPLPPGAIYNSNRFTLRGLLLAAGCEVHDLGIVPDRLDATRAALREAAAGNDLIITSGGVSVGEEDHVKPAVAAEGKIELWQVAIKPGKPLAFGSVGRALFLGLPGNPVSSFVTFVLAARAVLRSLQGLDAQLPAALPLQANFDWPRPDKRREFLRVRLNDTGQLELFTNQGSGVLTSLVWADGLVDVASGQAIARGDTVRFLPLNALLQ